MILAIVGFLQLSLCVRDLERPASAPSATLASSSGRAVVVSRDGLRIELFELDAARPAAPQVADPSPLHLVFAVDDLDSTLHSLRDRGVEVLEETRTRFAPGVVACFVRDPDGLPIQLYQAPFPVADL
jgi:hypothetical protein